MSSRVVLIALLLALLGACAEVPTAPAPAPSTPTASIPRAAPANPLASTIDAWRQRALNAKASSDLAGAEIGWHVLTLLAPDEPAYRQELAGTRAAIRREASEALQAGETANRAGDADRAAVAFLRVLALEPDNAEAARALRDLDRRKFGRIQADRAAKVRPEPQVSAAPSRARRASTVDVPTNGDGYDIEQRIEMFNAGDTSGGLRELRSWAEAHPQDHAGRQRVAGVVFDHAIDLEGRGAREQALTFYEAAIALRGDGSNGWSTRAQNVRKVLSNEYYDRATRAERTDLEAAVRALETSVRYDPGNIKASARLAQAKTALVRLKQIEKSPPK